MLMATASLNNVSGHNVKHIYSQLLEFSVRATLGEPGYLHVH